MKCQMCGENEAVVHFVELRDGERVNMWICGACAEREGIPIAPAPAPSPARDGFEAFLGGLFREADARNAGQLRCSACGHSFRRLRQSGLLGCPVCYQAFRSQLQPMLRRFHGRASHEGKLPNDPGPVASRRREIVRLKNRLQDSVQREDYEEAARCRDAIRALEAEAAAGAGPPPAEPGEEG